jgi:hypothetical protein
MTDAEFDAFVARSTRALDRKQAKLSKRFGLGSYARWDYDQVTERLRFSNDEARMRVEATAMPIGSFSTLGRTWQWAWANPSIPEGPRARAARLRELFEVTGVEVFRQEAFEADEPMAWELAAMAVAHLSAAGCYRGPVGHLHVFLAIENIREVEGAA